MKIGFLQFNVKFGDKDYNFKKVKELVENVNFDLLVLPELFNTGYPYSDDLNKLQEMKNSIPLLSENVSSSKSVTFLKSICNQKNSTIVAGIVENKSDKIYNSAVIVNSTGLIGVQRKIHLPPLEESIFTKGTEIKTFEVNNIKIGVAICFDTWFPEFCRKLMNEGCQILCHPANFGADWSLDIIRTRALENMFYTVTANRTGTHFRGESKIFDKLGNTLAFAEKKDCIKIVEIDPNDALNKETILCSNLYKHLEIYK